MADDSAAVSGAGWPHSKKDVGRGVVMKRLVAVAAAICVGVPGGAGAVDLQKSRLTSIDLKSCRQIRRHEQGGAWQCAGLPGYPVYIAEGDLRFMLGFGPNPERRRSATQTLAPFNTVFYGKRRPAIEWRVDELDGRRAVPFATIVRFRTTRDGQSGEVLVITKVDERESCMLAVVDARANQSPMALAREWAIANARKLACPETPVVLGASGKSPM